MTEPPTSTPDPAPKPVRRRASRAAGPTSPEPAVATVTTRIESGATSTAKTPSPAAGIAPPARRQPNRVAVVGIAAGIAVVLLAALGTVTGLLLLQKDATDEAVARDQRFVDTASQTVVNMFSYTPDTIDDSVNRFVDGTSGPLRDMMSQNNNVDNLKALFRDTNATSEAVVNGAALEDIDEVRDNASVLVAVRVTVTDIDGVNKPSQAYRLRVIVHEDDAGRMTGWDLKYPDGGN
ncbi:mammalian cell entry protein [[Mycobacterium] burgundiense]|uniref:Mammalian cell entry protein n=1 Tax=[Mycobacterium] burgundiense TaxID=3064286 RepID=A0ABN9MVL1_9MYCO|nr:mammalian cell entry protein [Mycolicibacterium sp. MU0053]CAJ1495791.1 mammalian cell entry protein [Mycolicibacterium sp. MU0053]